MNAYTIPASVGGMFSIVVKDTKDDDERRNVSQQWKRRPGIDEIICHYLDGETLKNALNFINYVRASKMKISWQAANVWSVRYKRKHVLDIIVKEGSWNVRLVYNHVKSNHVFSKRDRVALNSFIGSMKGSIEENFNTAPALS